jgi:hypothetical protein
MLGNPVPVRRNRPERRRMERRAGTEFTWMELLAASHGLVLWGSLRHR